MARPAWTLACLALLLAGSAVPAQDASTIYRCTAADGEVTIQNGTPCPAGARQEIRQVDALPTRPPPPTAGGLTVVEEPAYVPPPLSSFVQVAGPQDEPITGPPRPALPAAARIPPADRLPPPPIFRCETWDNDSYVSEDPAPKPRCVRLDTAGVGQACENKYDLCARIGDRDACDGWKQRQREIESGWRHARGQDKPALQEEFARVTKILTDSTCALPP
ncbi:DUF4124 domain-containing protein [Luteimonas kalidii]|uniref:DUF4124 domain-containing protein n=1 Tax=Luteimonas kalidii TaxID=3042025 RepID=A0ABT6JUL5_9GAMM|nr:DUF4124 domain-containing protein [Luteimonas kalidii]MDH5834269.1 DUF4124 domain-containing protein [Luteimonas kalidii]